MLSCGYVKYSFIKVHLQVNPLQATASTGRQPKCTYAQARSKKKTINSVFRTEAWQVKEGAHMGKQANMPSQLKKHVKQAREFQIIPKET